MHPIPGTAAVFLTRRAGTLLLSRFATQRRRRGLVLAGLAAGAALPLLVLVGCAFTFVILVFGDSAL